jgi:CheY-like chemotaxis protein
MRRLRASGFDAPIVALTASWPDGAKDEVLEAGANDMVLKPFKEAELLQRIGERLGITYIYERETAQPAAPAGAGKAQPLSGLLANVPAPLIEQLLEAAIQARASRIHQLAAEMSKHAPAAAEQILSLARDFRFEDLAALAAALESAGRPQ